MASLNPEAPEFIQQSYRVIQHNNNNPMISSSSYPTLPPLIWYPNIPNCYNNHPSCTVVMQTPSYISLHYNSSSNNNIIHVGPEWYMNSPLIIPPSKSPYFVPPPHGQEITANQHHGDARKKAIKGNKREVKKGWKPKYAGNGCIRAGDPRTTVMIRNIPSRFNRKKLVKSLDEHCMEESQKLIITMSDNPITTDDHKKEEEEEEEEEDEELSFPSEYDFVYLPIDFDSKNNKGYAFVNFTKPSGAWKLSLSWKSKKWDCFDSKKICEITYADIQGRDALIKHFENTVFACEEAEYLPVYFVPPRDGSGGSVTHFTIGRRIKPSGYQK